MTKLTYKALAVSTLISMIATSLTACRSSTQDQPSSVDNKDGIVVNIPPGGLYEEGDISIEPVDAPEGADTQTYSISGNPYDITAPGEYFRLPVEMEIPYDPSLLPENRTEAEVFPAYYFDGVWYRVDGEVDTESKTIKVATLHNGIWDWAWDKVDNWAGPEKAFFCDNSSAEKLSQARNNAEQARLELLSILEDAEMRVEEIDAPTDHVVELVLGEMKKEGTVFVLKGLAEVFRGKTAVRFIFGGKSAVIHIGGTKIATLLSGGATAINALGIVGTSIVFYKQAEAIGETSAQIYRIATAYKRFKEAKALVWGLENGCHVLSMPPEYEETLKEYYTAIPIDQTIDGPHELDLDFSLYQDLNDIANPLGLTPEELANSGTHVYEVESSEISIEWYGEKYAAEYTGNMFETTVREMAFSDDQVSWLGTDIFTRTGPNTYQGTTIISSSDLTTGPAILVFSLEGFTWTAYNNEGVLIITYTYRLMD